MTECKCTRRLFYYIPAEAEPDKVLSAIEPGIYMENCGVRLEFDVRITPKKKLQISGLVQDELLVV